MAKFNYTAVDKAGKQHLGTIEASDEATVSQLLARQNMRPISIKKESKKAGALDFLTRKKVKLKDLVIFTRQLSTMVNAGVPLSRSMARWWETAEGVTATYRLSSLTLYSL